MSIMLCIKMASPYLCLVIPCSSGHSVRAFVASALVADHNNCSFFFFKYYVYVFISQCVCHMYTGVHGVQKRVLNPLELE